VKLGAGRRLKVANYDNNDDDDDDYDDGGCDLLLFCISLQFFIYVSAWV
jgi:hypothetical protein